MKKLIVIAAFLGMVAVPRAKAAEITAYQTPGASYGHGGEFSAYGEPGDTKLPFIGQYYTDGIGYQTFCIESTVLFNPGQYYNYTIGQTEHDGTTLKMGTALLFSQFEAGTLAGYNYTYGTPYGIDKRNASAAYLQAAIWYFQGQGDPDGVSQTYAGNIFVKYAEDTLGGLAPALVASGGADGVQILQLTSLSGVPAQDWLAKVGSVPEGGCTLVLLGLGLTSLAALRKRQ